MFTMKRNKLNSVISLLMAFFLLAGMLALAIPAGASSTNSSVTVEYVDESGKRISSNPRDSWYVHKEEGVAGDRFRGRTRNGNLGPVDIPGYVYVSTQKPAVLAKDSKGAEIWDDLTCNSLFVEGVNHTIKHVYKKIKSNSSTKEPDVASGDENIYASSGYKPDVSNPKPNDFSDNVQARPTQKSFEKTMSPVYERADDYDFFGAQGVNGNENCFKEAISELLQLRR